MCCVCAVLQRGHSGDGCVLALTLCTYDLRKGDLFVLSEAGKYLFRAASVWWRVCSILLLSFVARCLKTIDVCIWRMFLCLL